MQQFYRPNGDSTQKRGVLSDVELPSLTTHLDVGEADLDYPVEFDKVEPLHFKRLRLRQPGPLPTTPPALRAPRASLGEISEGRSQHRPLQGAEGQEIRHAQRGEVPQGAGGTQCRQGRRKGHRETQRSQQQQDRARLTISTRSWPSPPITQNSSPPPSCKIWPLGRETRTSFRGQSSFWGNGHPERSEGSCWQSIPMQDPSLRSG